MAVDTKWDISRLSSLRKNLNDQKDILEQNRTFLSNINGEVETAWQGYAGRTFDRRMEIDIENLDIVIKNLDDLINDIDKIIKDCYEECEDFIKYAIIALKDMI